MRIAVNTRLLLKNKLEGIGWFTYESLKRIVLAHPEHEFYFIFDRKYDNTFVFADNVIPVVVGPPARHPILHFIWYELSIPRILKKINPDVFISPDAFISLSSKFPDIIVIHDLNFEHYPEHMPRLWQKYYSYFTPRYAKKVNRIITVSEYSKMDIVSRYGIDSGKIDVVYNGSGTLFKPLSQNVKNETKLKYTNNCNYFVFVGALNPRKNLSNIFRSFDNFKNNNGTDIKFVVVGEKMYWTDDIKQTYDGLKHKQDVVFTGRLEQDELSKVVGSSLALVYASFFEGFGIPIIEAFNAEVPVITSNITAMPEVAGDAALLVDPDNIKQIEQALHKIAFNSNFASQLVEKGKIRRNDFSWENTAGNVWASIEKTILNH